MKTTKSKNKEIKPGVDEFKARLITELDKLKVKPIEKECILNLIEREVNYPTSEDDAIDVYSQLLEISLRKLKGDDS